MSKRNGPPAWVLTQQRMRHEGGLLIVAGIQTRGVQYELDLSAKQRLEGVPVNTPRLPGVFLCHERDTDFETVHAPYWPWVVQMLTGLTQEQLAPFAPIRLFAQDLNKVVWQWQPDTVSLPR